MRFEKASIIATLLHPLAVLAGGITLVVGVCFAQLLNVMMLSAAGANWLKTQSPAS